MGRGVAANTQKAMLVSAAIIYWSVF